MEQETQWLEFNWRDKAYAVLMSDVEGIIHQNRRNRTQPLAMIPLVFLTDGSVDGEEKWLILLRNRTAQLALVADRIIGEVKLATHDSGKKEQIFGLFPIRQLN